MCGPCKVCALIYTHRFLTARAALLSLTFNLVSGDSFKSGDGFNYYISVLTEMLIQVSATFLAIQHVFKKQVKKH
jgi:hypothetical protein